jgi:glycosyltransferase involved in cell wall biosynthesis
VPVEVSVVIPTHNRPNGLVRLLDGLRRQTMGKEHFETIVVDDGSRVPVTVEPDGLQVRVLRHEQPRGPAAARNSGWRAASAAMVAFIDDDCVPAEGWLEALVAAADGDVTIVQGRVEPMPDQAARRRPLSHTIEVGAAGPLFISANIAYPRALLARLDGFDETLRRACGEDAELGARATQAGAVARFAREALVFHEIRELSLSAHLRHTMQWTDAVGVLARHPELRSLLTLRVFWKPTHPWLLAAAVAMATRRFGLAALSAVPYLRHYWRVYQADAPALARAFPTHLAIDTCEVATAIAGSIRHRTLML